MALNVIHPTMRNCEVLGTQFTISKPASFRAGRKLVGKVQLCLNFPPAVLFSFYIGGQSLITLEVPSSLLEEASAALGPVVLSAMCLFFFINCKRLGSTKDNKQKKTDKEVWRCSIHT